MSLKFNAEKHEYRKSGIKIPSVTQILRIEGFVDFSKVPQAVLEASWQFGTAVHKTTELYDKGTLDLSSLDKNLIPPLDAWIKFKKDYEVETNIETIEKHLYSRIWGFAGTPDRIDPIRGHLSNIDIKTGSEVYPSFALQTAGYKVLGCEYLGLKIKKRYAVVLTQDGKYKVIQYKEKSDENIFLSAVAQYHWKVKKGIHDGYKTD